MNLTLSVDEAVVERARERARAMGKSLNQVMREYLEQLAGAKTPDRWAEEWDRLSREAQGDSKGWKFNRDEIYDRDAARREIERKRT